MCDAIKPIGAFALDSSKKDGHRHICKDCNAIVSERYRRSDKGIANEKRHYRSVQNRIEDDTIFAQRRRDIVNRSTARAEYKAQLQARSRTAHGIEAKRASKAVEVAIDNGELRVPPGCARCGIDPGMDKLGRRKMRAVHIHGYAPEHHLDVEFMCPTCVNRLTKVERLT
jgi:hypothetical protein